MPEQIDFQPSQSYEDAIARAAAENRIEREYWDIFHKRHVTSIDVQKGILIALGWDVSSAETVDRERAYLPDSLRHGGRTAGFNITLYGLRCDRNWGCGDFTDLRALIDWAHDQVGFTFIWLNPLHALHNRIPFNTSPYLPLSLYYEN